MICKLIGQIGIERTDICLEERARGQINICLSEPFNLQLICPILRYPNNLQIKYAQAWRKELFGSLGVISFHSYEVLDGNQKRR
jgi:hypothetical protein